MLTQVSKIIYILFDMFSMFQLSPLAEGGRVLQATGNASGTPPVWHAGFQRH